MSVFSPARLLSILLLQIILVASAFSQEKPDDSFANLLQPVLQKSCIQCHGQNESVEGEVNLLALKSDNDLTANLDLLNDILEALQDKAMPPEDEPTLDPEIRTRLVAYLQNRLHAAIIAQKRYAPTPLRRMNRFQYNNAVRDLFELDRMVFTLPERILREHGNYFQPATGKMPDEVRVGSRPLGKSQLIEKRLAGVAAFPQDLRAEHGFDNRADHLSLSPLLLESFMTLSRSILESPDFHSGSCGIWNQFFAAPEMQAETKLDAEVRQRLQRFLTRAFRRPVEEELLDRYSRHVLTKIENGVSFTQAMQSAASAAIASPRFFYLFEWAGARLPVEPLDDYELASRLSFFLWGSIPDETLLTLAESGTLHNPEVLGQQVDRMLKNRKLKRFCDSFPAQWLQLDRIISSVPNRDRFPEFYFSKYRTSMHLMLEPLLLFETVLIENRSILDLIDPDFSYRSDRIENLWYGKQVKGNLGPVTAIPFRRVKITDRRQGGVITNAGVMTMTSGPERTKPITRGAWLATVIFNNPPPPPPGNVPPLSDKPNGKEATMTLRERLIAHREQANCAGCHEKIDPLGFALENYNPIGKWRDVYDNGRQVDMQGTLFKKHKFENAIEFKNAILAEKDRFTNAFASHLLSFALARETDVTDTPVLDKIVLAASADEYRIQTIIRQIVLSEPFRTKVDLPPEPVEFSRRTKPGERIPQPSLR